MTTVSIKDIRLKTKDELKQMLLDCKREQFNLRFQKVSGQLKNTARCAGIRKEIARIKTVLAKTSTVSK